MKKMGRPTDDPKTYIRSVRFSDADKAKIDYCIERTGLTAPEIIRKGVDAIYRSLTSKEDNP